MPTAYSLDNIRAALALPAFDGPAAQRHMAPIARPMSRPNDRPDGPRLGGVLILLYCADEEFYVVLTQRSDYDGVHAGQVSCPGGRHEPPETLREFKELSERSFLVQKLRENNWNISRTAEVIGTPRSNLYKKLEFYKIAQEIDG